MSKTKRKRPSIHMSTRAKLIAGLVVLVCLLVFALVRYLSVRKERIAVAKGIERLSQVDSEEAERAAENAVKKKQRDEITKLLEKAAKGEGDFNPWSYFNDSVVMGDSRSVGFYVFDYLPQSRVMAEAGNTIQTIDDYMDDLKAINPSYVFLCYGLNDVTSGRWDSADDWVKDYKKYYDKLKSEFPHTEFCINSILPVTEAAKKTNERVTLVPEYAEALKKYAEKNQITFIDCDELVEEHKDQIVDDGIHFLRTFYPYWAGEMIMTAYIGDGDEAKEESGESAQENQE